MLAALNEEKVGARGQGWGFRLLQGSGEWGGIGGSRGQIGKDLIGEFQKFTFLILSMVEWEREDYYIYSSNLTSFSSSAHFSGSLRVPCHHRTDF